VSAWLEVSNNGPHRLVFLVVGVCVGTLASFIAGWQVSTAVLRAHPNLAPIVWLIGTVTGPVVLFAYPLRSRARGIIALFAGFVIGTPYPAAFSLTTGWFLGLPMGILVVMVASSGLLTLCLVVFLCSLVIQRRGRRTAGVFRDTVLVFVLDVAPPIASLLVTLIVLLGLSSQLVSYPMPLLTGLVTLCALIGSYGTAMIGTGSLRFFQMACPPTIRESIDEAQRLCEVRFDRVIYVGDIMPTRRLLEVRLCGRGQALCLNQAAIDGMTLEECLAAVTHELGHVRHRHLYKEAARIALMAWLLLIVTITMFGDAFRHSPLFAFVFITIVSLVRTVVHQRFRRQAEREADRYAAGIIGAGPLIRVLTKLSSQSVANNWLGSHDSPLDRIEQLRQPVDRRV
jgi:Zn-dependent protease with chaperone function